MVRKIRDVFIGAQFKPNHGGSKCVVKSIERATKVTIKWLDDYGHEAVVQASCLRVGEVKNPYHLSVFGVACIGSGVFCASSKYKSTKEYCMWVRMLERCYKEDCDRYSSYGAIGVRVCKDWLNFQNFAAWITAQPYWGCDNFQIDKDILGCGYEYSPLKCCYIPASVNIAVRSTFDRAAGNVTEYSTNKGSRWEVVSHLMGEREYLGVFSSLDEAETVSVAAKKRSLAKLANTYIEHLTRDVYDKLLQWEAPFMQNRASHVC